MHGAGWQDIVEGIINLVAHEPPFVQILIGLGAAFCALMVLEGLRANFVPRRSARPAKSRDRMPPPPQRSAVAPAPQASQPYRSTTPRPGPLRNPKRSFLPLNRHRPPRPKISRRQQPGLIETPGHDAPEGLSSPD